MSVESCPDPEELQRLIEERLGPVRAAEIEAHVETCRPCQDQLERLTARGAKGKDDRATHEASGSPGPVVDGSMMADSGGRPSSTELPPFGSPRQGRRVARRRERPEMIRLANG